MAKSIQLRFATALCWFFASLTCCAVAYAADNDKFVTGIEAIPFRSFGYVLIIIVVAGPLATLSKMTKKDRVPITDLPLEIIKDQLGSLAAGVLAFLTVGWIDTTWVTIDVKAQVGIIFFSAYGGNRLIESIANDKFFPLVHEIFDRITGRSKGNGTST